MASPNPYLTNLTDTLLFPLYSPQFAIYHSQVKEELHTFTGGEAWRFDASVGGTFTLASKEGDSSTFFSDKAGLIHLQLRAQRNVRITPHYTLPVFACAVFNPVMDRSFFQIGAQVFTF